MEKPNRKQNRLDNYDYGQEGSYFITLCTQNRAQLFDMEPLVENGLRAVPNRISNQMIHKWIRETVNRFPNISVDQYVIMSDHLHFMITIKERRMGCTIPDVMWFFKTMTTNEYMRCVKAGLLPPFDKKLWQKSYYDHVVRNQRDYNEIWEYIQQNPLKWEWIYSDTP